MKACMILGSLKPDYNESNTFKLAGLVANHLQSYGCEVYAVPLAKLSKDGKFDHGIKIRGATDCMPDIIEYLSGCDIIIIATSTWWGNPSSLTQQFIERLDDVQEYWKEGNEPLLLGKCFGVVCTGNSDGAQAIIARLNGWASHLAMVSPPFNSLSYIGEPDGLLKGNMPKHAEAMADNLYECAKGNYKWSYAKKLDRSDTIESENAKQP